MVIVPSLLVDHIHAPMASHRKSKNVALQKDSGQGRGGGVV
jgi:hypothetical protein